MGLCSFMAALIFFLGAVAMAPAGASVDLPGAGQAVTVDAKTLMGEGFLESEVDAVPALGFNELLLLRGKSIRGTTAAPSRTFITPGDKAFFVGNTGFNSMNSYSDVFGYSETKSFRFFPSGLSPRNFGNEYSCAGTSSEFSKNEFVNTLKEGLHYLLKIDPRYNPFLWRHLLKAQLGDYSVGLDARVGSTMYVSPKVSWTRRFMGMPLATEVKWVPILRTTNSNSDRKNYVLLKCSFKF